jgi:hypothetical protein
MPEADQEKEEEINLLNSQRIGQLRALISVLDIGFSPEAILSPL